MIGVNGSGIEDTALITFMVRDGSGNAAPDDTDVSFSIATGVSGGESLSATSATTAGGKVVVALQAGDVSGTVTVEASFVDDDGNTISTVAPITIVSNRPDAEHLTLGAENLNLAGGVTLGLQTTVHAYLGDRAGNVVPDGTPVSFFSECGTIGESSGFTATSSFGVASAVFQSSAPTVPNLGGLEWDEDGDGTVADDEGLGNVGLCRIMAATPGKGPFQDNNGNGVFDSGDVCTADFDEPYIDANDNGQYDAGEYYVDVDASESFSYDVADCTEDVMLWSSMNLLISGFSSPLNLLPETFSLMVGESQTFVIDFEDAFGNALVEGTRFEVKMTDGSGSEITDAGGMSGITEFTMPDTNGLGASLSFSLASDAAAIAATPVTLVAKIVPPSGVNNNGAEYLEIASGQINLQESPEPPPAPSSGNPANILMEVSTHQISVAGVGQEEQANFKITIVDDAGVPIVEDAYADETLNNVRVSFITSPHGGEYIAGGQADGSVTSSSGSILVRSADGIVPLNLQAGTLPGNVELQVEVLYDADGVALLSPVTAKLPQVAISSGPPHTISLTSALLGSVENMVGMGVYRRQGTAMVTDRYGNNVPDGTIIYLGLIDSVIAEGTATSIAGDTVTAAAGAFDATITRNEIERGIQPNDRILLRGVPAQDKSRHVVSAEDTQLISQSNYTDPGYAAKDYLVGSSLLGSYISGTAVRGDISTFSPGSTVTRDGLADIYVTYPANVDTINVGCGVAPTLDDRHPPLGSSKVIVVAASSDDSATTVDEGQFCFTPIAGFGLAASPAKLNGTGTVLLEVVDGGDEIPVPYTFVSAYVTIDTLGINESCSDLNYLEQDDCLEPTVNTWTEGSCSEPTLLSKTDCELVRTWTPAGECSDGISLTKATCVLANSWTVSGVCSDGTISSEPDCLAASGVWTNTSSCSDPSYASQAACEQPHTWTDLSACSDAAFTTQVTCEQVRTWTDSMCSNPVFTTQTSCEAEKVNDWLQTLSDFDISVSSGYSDKAGSYLSIITVGGVEKVDGDKATVTFVAGDASVDVVVEIKGNDL
ncbi:MAG: hypothetical protein C0618_07305 [Desulfuromonas sp.]|nr:MAG: hypothetical protein C0618_07305 [Desulfuromonas sp.]